MVLDVQRPHIFGAVNQSTSCCSMLKGSFTSYRIYSKEGLTSQCNRIHCLHTLQWTSAKDQKLHQLSLSEPYHFDWPASNHTMNLLSKSDSALKQIPSKILDSIILYVQYWSETFLRLFGKTRPALKNQLQSKYKRLKLYPDPFAPVEHQTAGSCARHGVRCPTTSDAPTGDHANESGGGHNAG